MTFEELVMLNLSPNASTWMVTVDHQLTPLGTELRDMLIPHSPHLSTTLIDIGGRSILPVMIEPHGVAIYR